MRFLPIAAPDGSLQRDVGAIYMAYSYFPEDPASRESFVTLWKHELQRYESAPKQYEMSRFAKSAFASIDGKRAQFAVAGLTAIAMYFLKKHDARSQTRYQASRVVAAMLKNSQKVHGFPLFTESRESLSGDYAGLRAPMSPEDIEKHFNRYNSVAHLWAAKALVDVRPSIGNGFDIHETFTPRYLLAAWELQNVLCVSFPQYLKDPWLVPVEPPEDMAPSIPELEHMRPELEAAFQQAMVSRGLV